MLTEIMIREMIPEILMHFDGMATKKEVCDFIEKTCDLDKEEDLSKSNSRNEPKYVQRVGNIISHARKKGLGFIQFKEGFEIAKIIESGNNTQWVFILPKKELNRLCMEVEDEGKKYVYESEKAFVLQHFPDKIENVILLRNVEGDAVSYDVKSVCHTNPEKALLIKVKSTTFQDPDLPFNMSGNELEFFKTHNEENEVLELYRLYDRKENGFRLKIYSKKEILENFKPIPVMFKMKFK